MAKYFTRQSAILGDACQAGRSRAVNRSSRIVCLTIVAAGMLPASRAEAHEGWGIVVDATGRVYVGDIPANIIWRISKEGKLERVALGKHSHALVLDAAGNV